MIFNLPNLPYAENALEPHISAETIRYHYGKHHQAYVNNLNKLIPGSAFENASLEDIVRKAEGGIFNNGAQVWNHTFYWNCLSPQGAAMPDGKLLKAIERDFGGFDSFKNDFTAAALTLFGSGWVWLAGDGNGKLSIVQSGNAGNPLRDGLTPLLTCDVWEHAYYIDKRNSRPDYVASFWEVIDWKAVTERL